MSDEMRAERLLKLAKQVAETNTILRKIAAHVPGKVWIAAKEAAGFGESIHALINDPKVDEAWVEFATADLLASQPAAPAEQPIVESILQKERNRLAAELAEVRRERDEAHDVEWQAAELARVREERDTLKKILEQDCKDWAENDDKLAKDLEEYRINDGYFQSGYDLVDCCIADRNKLRSELALAREERDRIADLLETAFGIIANATSGNWLKEGEWLFAANKFRDAYNAWLNGYVATLPPPEAK